MVVTRGQERAGVKGEEQKPTKAKREAREPETKKPKREPKQGKPKEESKTAHDKEAANGPTDVKKQKGKKDEEGGEEEVPLSASATSKIHKLVSEYGTLPLQDAGLSEPDKPTAETALAHTFDGMLKAARISHDIADDTVRCLIKAGYHDVQVLKKSTWEERTEVLTEGGYAHYRERVATELGDLADWVIDKYDGDLNNLHKQASSRSDMRHALKEIKGVGDLGVDIFFISIQHLWTDVAPWISARSLETAEHIGIGKDVDAIYAVVGKNPREMCKLSRALTQLRLDKKEEEYK